MYPTLIDFGPIAVHSFGLMMALGFLAVLLISQRDLARKGLDPRPTSSIIFAAAVGGIIGAKLYSALQDGRIELAELISNTGLVWYGGVIGALAAVLFVIHRSPNPILPTIDTIGMATLLGYGIGRIGCFLAGRWGLRPPLRLAVGDGVSERHSADGYPRPSDAALRNRDVGNRFWIAVVYSQTEGRDTGVAIGWSIYLGGN